MLFRDKNSAAYLFILANLCFAFLFTLAFGYGLTITYSIFTFVLLLTLKNRKMYSAVCLISALVAMVYCPVGLTFGPPDLNAITSMAYTDKSESVEFLLSLSVWKWLASCSVLFSAVACILLKHQVSFSLPRFFSVISFIVFFSSPLKAAYKEKAFSLMESHYPPVRFAHDAYGAYSQMNADKAFYQRNVDKPDSWQPARQEEKYDTVVVVIGESVRRDFMSVHGFPVTNTPFMQSVPGLTFSNYISSGPATVLSLTHSLYRFHEGNIEYNNSIVRLLSKSGYYTNWISNQGVFGGADSPVSLAGKQADEFHFIKSGSSNKFLFSPDEKMLPLVSEGLQRKGKKAIFIHLMGSHPVACVRTNGRYDVFFRNKEESCYVQSIKNTDAFLSGVQGMLKKSAGKWAMVYFADHGLMVTDRNSAEERLIHSDIYKSDYNVPLFITAYDVKEKVKIDAPRSGFDFIAMIAQVAGISEPSIHTRCDLLSNNRCAEERRVIKKNGTFVSYDSLPVEAPLY